MDKLKSSISTYGKQTLHQVVLIVISILLATLFLIVAGYDPMGILKGIAASFTTDIAGTIRWAAPMILAGVAICVPFTAEIFNLGVDGQIYLGAAGATLAVLYLPPMPPFLAFILIFLAGMLFGALFALIPALLNVYFDTNIVVTTLLLNFVGSLFVDYLVAGPIRNPDEVVNQNSTILFPRSTWLPRLEMFAPSAANVGIFIALGAAVLAAIIIYKTKIGHEIKIVGANSELARYSGMQTKKLILQTMMLSGAVAGSIGVIEVLAIQHRLLGGMNPGLGFNGIVVSLLAGNNPIGVIFSGTFFAALKNGGINMERTSSIPAAVTELVMALIILTIGAKFAFPKVKESVKKIRQAVTRKERT